MDWLQVWVLALVQGITEFLPISSAAHLILVPVFTAWEDQGLAFDVATHVGTLLAILLYFRREVLTLTRAWWGQFRGAGVTPEAWLAWAVLLGTLPAALAGWALAGLVSGEWRSPTVIALTTIGFGLLLWYADRRHRGQRDEWSLGWRDILLIGGAQALALLPGTSRSGVTMTMALWLGFSRKAAARYSFLLAIPIIAMAGAYQGLELWQAPPASVEWDKLLVGALLAGVAAWLVVSLFLRLIERIGMLPFVVYRIFLGILLLSLQGNVG
jgi:undecaprenyl-diphosphatase